MIDIDDQGHISLKIQKLIMPSLATQPPKQTHNNNDELDCFMVPADSQSPSFASTYIFGLLHGPDCFSLSTMRVYLYGHSMVFPR